MPTIVKLQNGKYRAMVRKTGHRTQSAVYPTRKEALAWAAKVDQALNVLGAVDRTKPKKKTKAAVKAPHVKVSDLFEHFRDTECLTRKGGRWETKRINKLLETAAFMKTAVTELSAREIRAWRNERLTSVQPCTVNREMNLLSKVFSHALLS